MEEIQKDFWEYKGMYIQRLYSDEWIVFDGNEKQVAKRANARDAKSYIDKWS